MSKLKKDLGTIQRAVQILAGTYNKDLLSFEVAKVITVDTANWLCSAQLVSGTVQTTYNNVQLTAEKASNGFIQVPKINSNVILAITWRNEVYVFMCSEVDALVFHQKNTDGSYEEFTINCNSGFNPSLPLGMQITDGGGNGITIGSKGAIQLNDGSYGGLTEINNLTAKLNNLVAQTQTELGKIMAAITALSGAYAMGTLSTFSTTDYENTDITHGPKL